MLIILLASSLDDESGLWASFSFVLDELSQKYTYWNFPCYVYSIWTTLVQLRNIRKIDEVPRLCPDCFMRSARAASSCSWLFREFKDPCTLRLRSGWTAAAAILKRSLMKIYENCCGKWDTIASDPVNYTSLSLFFFLFLGKMVQISRFKYHTLPDRCSKNLYVQSSIVFSLRVGPVLSLLSSDCILYIQWLDKSWHY